MRLTKEFQVGKPEPAVWALFQDVDAVAQCMPGAEVTEDKVEGVVAGRVSVKLGPLNPTFEGEATVTYDHESRHIHLNGSGVDRKGGSRGRVNVEVELSEAEHGTSVSVDATVTLSGAASRFGRTGLMEEMANRLIADFVECLESKLAATSETGAAAVQARELRGISLLMASLLSWLRHQVKKVWSRSANG